MDKRIRTALADKKFMIGVREAQAEATRGDRGTLWSEVKKDLGLKEED